MPELEDLWGRDFHWTLRRERPVLCAIYEGSSIVGTIEGYRDERALRARFAGVDWSLDRTGGLSRTDRIAFADGGEIAVCEVWVGGYEIEIDGAYRYRLTPGARRCEWRDARGEGGIGFRRSGPNLGTSGNFAIDPAACLAHAPILVLAGILRGIRGRLFHLESREDRAW